MSQKKLDLLQFAPAIMTQLGTGSPQVVGGNVLQPGALATASDHIPDNILRDASAPYLSQSGNGSKDFALADPGGP